MLWPENWQAFEIFSQLSTQWRAGFAGPTGLDYPALFQLLDRHGLTGDEWWIVFDDIRLLETAALDAMRGQKPG